MVSTHAGAVSVCMIVRDERDNLAACLSPVRSLCDDIVVVDTGSTDGTPELALGLGARVYEFPWRDSFADARNEGLRHARGRFILSLDADDRIDADNVQSLARLVAGLGDGPDAYELTCRLHGANAAHTDVAQVRLFPNHPEIRWVYRVHEQISPAVVRRGGRILGTDVVLTHIGYEQSQQHRAKKARNLRLLDLAHAESPNDPFIAFYLGWHHRQDGDPARSVRFLEESLRHLDAPSAPTRPPLDSLFVLLVRGYRDLGRADDARAVCREGRSRCPDDAELLFLDATLRQEGGDPHGARRSLEALLQLPAEPCLHRPDPAHRNRVAQHRLAEILAAHGQHAEAQSHWRRIIDEHPDFSRAWLGLADHLIAGQDWRQLDALLHRLAADSQRVLQTALVGAQMELARGNHESARHYLEHAAESYPDDVLVHELLGHVLLVQGSDWRAAEESLNRVLALSPGHAGARRNLAVLRKRVAAGDFAPE